MTTGKIARATTKLSGNTITIKMTQHRLSLINTKFTYQQKQLKTQQETTTNNTY